jgi:hypothetical protein
MSTVGGGVNIVTNGLVLYLDAANTKSYISGSTTWNDISRGGNNGTLVNGPAFSGSNGGSIVFDGVNDYVNCGNSTTLNLNQHSICFWFYPKQDATKEIIYKASSANSSPGPYEVFQFVGNRIYYRLNANSTPNTTQTGTILLILNTWQYICATYDNIRMKTYINTTLDINAPFTTTLTNSTGVLNIGAYTDTQYAILANISQVQVYNRALTQQEVTQNYNATKTRFNL